MASAFGVFQIVANDGRQDHMLMATELLNQRINRIKEVRSQAGFEGDDIMPSILDIERTHIIFVTAHFKPFAAIAFEYHRVESSGMPSLSGTVQYSLPMYGDFFADMAHHVVFEQFKYIPGAVSDINKDSYRFADFVGERFHKEVKFTVNGNKLDDYTADAYSMHRQFNVAPNKKAGYYRMVGQELPHEAFLAQETEVQPMSRVGMEVYDGFQTPKRIHPALEVTVPLLFWFCKDFRLAIPSVAIPYGQRWITISTAKANELVEIVSTAGTNALDTASTPELKIASTALYVNNLFVNADVHDIFIKRIGFTLIRVHLRHEYECTSKTQKVKLESLQWPIEAMYFGFKPKINYDITAAEGANRGTTHPMYSRLSGRGTLQNWHRFNHVDLTSDAVAGVQTSKIDTNAEKDYKAIAFVAALTPVPANPAAIVLSVGNALNAEHGILFPKSAWGKYAVAAIEASAAYECMLLGVLVGATSAAAGLVQAAIVRIANEYRESNLLMAVPLNTATTAVAQAALYTTAINAMAAAGVLKSVVSDDVQKTANAASLVHDATAQTVWEAVQLSGQVHRHVRMGNTARVEVKRGLPTVSNIGLSAHNVKLYEDQYASFFHSYLPYQYGGPNLNTPDDESLYLISFALYPGTYQPSGHLNISRAREFHLTYTATRTPSSTEVLSMLVYVKAINFLLIADGSASLRYTT
jgi:hypothetical protein